MTLRLVNAANARDVGGVTTVDGRQVRTGLVFRANALNRLTDADLDAVQRLGLACVIDLRSEREVELVGPDRLPSPPPARLVSLPLADPGTEVFSALTAIIKGDPAALQTPFDRTALAAAMLRTYRWLATSQPARSALTTALRLMAEPDGLPMLFHCTAGKDRTGWLTAVLLTALGVDRATVVADYLRTTELNREGVAFVVGRLAGRVPDPSAVLPMLEVRPEYLAEAFDAAESTYGDMTRYLHEGLGLDDVTLAALRANLLE